MIKSYIEEILKINNGLLYLSNDIVNPRAELNKLLYKTSREFPFYERFHMSLANKYINPPKNEYEKIEISCKYVDYLNKNYKRLLKDEIIKLIFKTYSNSSNRKFNSKHDFIWDSSICNPIFIENIPSTFKHFKTISKSSFFYRGHSNYTFKSIPSIYREDLIYRENSMYRDLLIRNPESFDKTKSTFEKLTIMQHHGLPTRLLDITKNPMVSLYFACDDDSQKSIPGEVIIIESKDEHLKYYDSDTVSVISNLAKVERTFKIESYNKLSFNNHPSTEKLIHLIKEDKPYFKSAINPIDLERTIIVKPINNNERIRRQQGYFIIFGANRNVLTPANFHTKYNDKNESLKINNRYIIPHSYKSKILDELEIIGISSDTLFPEIDNGTKYIRNKK